jgi:hypothetical protein
MEPESPKHPRIELPPNTRPGATGFTSIWQELLGLEVGERMVDLHIVPGERYYNVSRP